MHVAGCGTQPDKESGFAGVTLVKSRSELERAEAVRKLSAEGCAHLNHHLVQGANRLQIQRIGARRVKLQQDQRAVIVPLYAEGGQDLREVPCIRLQDAGKSSLDTS